MNVWEVDSLPELIAIAKREDFGGHDVTTELMPSRDEPATFSLLAKQPGVFCGREVAVPIVHAYDAAIKVHWTGESEDGFVLDHVPTALARLEGPLGSILSSERVLLNFLQRLCGVATLTRAYVDAVAGTAAGIYDTRKTVPAWRSLDKYAVRCGRGRNHRIGLYDAVLIKDNHLAGIEPGRLAPAVFDMLNRMHAKGIEPAFVEVEADTPAQVEALLAVTGIDVVLLDNFDVDDLRRAVELRDGYGLRGKVELEASGGVTLETVRAIAETGVERISVGAITHSAPALDLSLERC